MSNKFNYTHSVNFFWSLTFTSHRSFLFSLILFFAYASIFLIALLANIFVIVMIIKRRRMRTLTNRFLLNLAISDLLATLICLPPTAYHYYDKRWIFGEFLCRFIPFMQGTSVAVSIFTLMAVSIDRFIAIQKPIHSKLLCTPTRITITIVLTWVFSFLLMIPLIFHHRIVDPFDITLTACAEEWHQNMLTRLFYDSLLLILLFILPMTLMTYCYIRISFSLWFIDSNIQTSLSTSMTHTGRFSGVSEDFLHDLRRPSTRSFHLFAKKLIESHPNTTTIDEHRSSVKTVVTHRRNTLLQDQQRCAASVVRRFSEADSNCKIQMQNRTMPMRQAHYASGLLHSSLTSLPSQHRMIHHRSMIDLDHTSRFLRSRRRVVKLLITLILVFFMTRIPWHILSIYIDVTSNTYFPDTTLNTSSSNLTADVAALYSSYIDKSERKMFFVIYINPIFQLLSLSNSAINPLCYCFMSHAVKPILTFFQQKLRRGQKKCSSLTLVR